MKVSIICNKIQCLHDLLLVLPGFDRFYYLVVVADPFFVLFVNEIDSDRQFVAPLNLFHLIFILYYIFS